MRVSTILELLLIFLIIAFSAYGRVIERDARAIQKKQSAVVSLKQATDSVNKYCRCNENICNCCREFNLPLVKLPGPGCASLQYIPEDKLAMQLTVGDNILSTNVVNGKNPEPVCIKLPGGFSKFCGKVYNIQKEEDRHFKACLGLELQSSRDELEATLRVSCFRFGPDGLKLRPAEPYPSVVTKAPSGAASSDDDYEDIFGLDEDDEDDEEDDDYEKVSPDGNNNVANAENNETQDNEDDDEEDDLLGFGALLDIFTGGDDSSSKKKPKGTTTTTTPIPSAFAIPIIHLSTEKPATAASKAPVAASVANDNLATPTENADVQKTQSESVTVNDIESETTFDLFEDTTKNDEEDSTSADFGITEEPAPAPANKVAPTKVTPSPKPAKITKVQAPKKKVTLTSNSPNAITDVKKPAHQDNDDDDQDDEYDYSDGSDEDDEEESNEEAAENDDKHESDKNAEEDDVHEYGDDDDDEEEDAVLSALVEGSEEVGKASGTKKDKMKATTRKPPHRQEIDYDEYLGLLSRNRPARTAQGINRGRQSKVMRL